MQTLFSVTIALAFLMPLLLGLLVLPGFSALIYFEVRARRNKMDLTIPIAVATLSVFLFGFWKENIRFVSHFANAFCFGCFVLLLSFTACFLLNIRMRPVRYTAFALALLLICALEFVVIAGSLFVGPEHVEQMSASLVCRITSWGFPGTQGVDARLYRRWRTLPIIEHEVANVSETARGRNWRGRTTCPDVLEKYYAENP